MLHCNNAPQPGDESGDRTQSLEAIRNGGEEADFLKSLASCRRRRSLGGGGGGGGGGEGGGGGGGGEAGHTP